MSGPFKRTTCACDECVACCRRQPGYLVPADVAAIGAYLGEPAEPFLVDSPGAVLGQIAEDGSLETFRVRTIVPRTDRTGRCVFLEDDGRCVIHPVAPYGCAMFDVHMSSAEAEPRQRWGVRQILDAGYQELRRTLPKAVSYNPTR